MALDFRPFLSKALQNLKASQLLLEEGLQDAAVTRTYFAAYHAARAALRAETGRDADDHKDLQATFAAELVNRRKVYPGKQGVLPALISLRHQADYDEEMVSAKRATRAVKKARAFVLAIQEELEK